MRIGGGDRASYLKCMVPVLPMNGCEARSLTWRYNGQLFLTTIVKATLSMPARGPMQLVDPQPIRRRDVRMRSMPAASLEAVSDCAPLRPKADVMLVGEALGTRVRLALVRAGETLIDKTLDGRMGDNPNVLLVYERALGGIGCKDNPLGTGIAAGDDPPSVVHAAEPRRPGAGFGPIPSIFPRAAHGEASCGDARWRGATSRFPMTSIGTIFKRRPPTSKPATSSVTSC